MAAKTKRKKQTRNTGRRDGRPGCLSRLLFIAFLIIALTAAVTVFFKINRIQVEGAERYTAEQLRLESGVEVGDNLIFLNKVAVSRRLYSALPYINDIKISRRLPDTLIIEITEAREVGIIKGEKGYWITDEKGKLLANVSSKQSGLVEVTGVTLQAPEAGSTANFGAEDNTKLTTLTETIALLEQRNMLKDTGSIGLLYVYDVEFEYLGRFLVKLGMPESLDYKLDFLEKILNEEIGKNERGIIDLTDLMETGEARFIPEGS